ncbi:sugar ABC transporter [Paraburkholderia susongensis]|uniref:Capsular polysaccharide transport system permease protein n=1 Tax=Paraburkholderia susongensis TaxID=1515439 RepID=A0A1X7I3X3_9BURK|nr:sugar ABC transporter [Paraburkholderia susongensis]SMG08913.1 capsular polysaccharide transport system permease protein [Paraburkholderia susongensis]
MSSTSARETSSASSAELPIAQRAKAREEALRARRRRRLVTIGLVFVPVVLTALYALVLAAPRYGAEARFSVRSSASPATAQSSTSLLSSGNSAAGGFVDGWAVADFIRSRDGMRQLDSKIGLRKYLAYTDLDPVNRLSPEASEDQLYRAYLDAIDVSYNMIEQINVLRVSAFSPADARTISDALIGLAQQFVNTMDEKGIADTLKVSREAVTRAEKDAIDARGALADWRVRNGNIDPQAEAGMLLNLSAQLESELNTAKINLDKVRALNNPNHPMLQPAQMQVSALRKQLDNVRARMSGKGNTEASRLKSYQALLNAQTFADQNLASARQNYQQAFTDTLRLQRYLSVIARPVPEAQPGSPNVSLLLIEALAVGFVFALAVRMAEALYREFRHG